MDELEGFHPGDNVKILRSDLPYSPDLVGRVGRIDMIANKEDRRIAVDVGWRVWVNSDQIEKLEGDAE